jgi:cellulose synthase/poly-beta-1,6-N-acetylglucosamine synthase-like glycosyltransferase
MPLVSVVIPAYNAQSTLSATLDSARSQTFHDLEIIVVDDGSTDETLSVAKAAAASDARIIVLTRPNGGVAASRNLGIHSARGEYIAPLDADDIWHPTKIEKQVRVLRDNPNVGLVFTWYRSVDAHNAIIESSPPSYARGSVYTLLLVDNFVGNASSPLIRKSTLIEAGLYNSDLRATGCEGAEDFQMQLSVAALSDFDVVPEYLLGYRVSPASMSTNYSKMLRSHIEVLRLMRERKPDVPSRFFRWSEGIACAYYGSMLCKSSGLRAAVRPLLQALIKDPFATLHLVLLPFAAEIYRRISFIVFGSRTRSRIADPIDFYHADPTHGPSPQSTWISSRLRDASNGLWTHSANK